MTDTRPPILEARNIHRRYRVGGGLLARPRSLTALDGVDIVVPAGGVVGLVGESGSGKSTLVRLLLGLERPDEGFIRLDGEHTQKLSRKAISRRVQPVFQDPFGSLNPSQRIDEIVALPLTVHRIGSRDERRQRVRRLLEMVGLPQRLAGARPRELSGGQRQRVAIARALAIQPELLICDEPTSALDVSVQAQILNLLNDLRRETGVAILLISHDLGVIEHMADSVAVIYLGRIVEQGPIVDIFSRPCHPYTQALQAAVLTPEDEKGIPDLGLGATFPNPFDIPTGCRFHPRCPLAVDLCRQTDPEVRPVSLDHFAWCHRAEEAIAADQRTDRPNDIRTAARKSSTEAAR